jgi:hypothetical protein
VGSILDSLLAENVLLLWYISGVGGVVLMYHPHSGDTYPLDRAGLPPLLVKEGMFNVPPPILGMNLLDEGMALAAGSCSGRNFFIADLTG